MEGGFMMALHSLVIGVLSYLVMLFILKQDSKVAEDRSVLLTGIVLIYMVLFGHNLPTNGINSNIL